MYKVQILASRESKTRQYLLIPKDVKIEIVQNFTDYNSDDEELAGIGNEETERKKLVPLLSPRFGQNSLSKFASSQYKPVATDLTVKEPTVITPESISNITIKGKATSGI